MIKVLSFPLRLAWSVLVVLTPVLGVWLASSLTAYLNGPVWAAFVAGALLFPILPLLWEWRATAGWNARQAVRAEKRAAAGQPEEEPAKRWLTFWDRMTWRTLALNLVFIGGLLATFPEKGFTALSTRGDWMLQEQKTAEAETARDVLFTAASRLEWLHDLARDNPYEKFDDGSAKGINPEPNPIADTVPSDTQPAKDTNTPRNPGEVPTWPMPESLHPIVTNIPPEHEVSPESVAKYIASRESDPFLRVKALHDYVADRIAYDAPALARGEYPPQDVDTVFKTRVAVCAGYATLLSKMGEYTGDEIVYISGDSRGLGGDVSGGGHAWNAAKIEGRWYLLDATWSAGSVEGTTFKKQYSTGYLFTPPSIFVHDHYPDNASWQLLKEPVSKGDFVRMPVLKPTFFARGYELISPKRSQVSTSQDKFQIALTSKKNVPMLARVIPKGQLGSNGKECEILGVDRVTITCDVPGSGTYQVWLFSKDVGTQYGFVGQIELNRS